MRDERKERKGIQILARSRILASSSLPILLGVPASKAQNDSPSLSKSQHQSSRRGWLPRPPPSQNRACDFHRTRLKLGQAGFGISGRPRYRVFGSVYSVAAVANFCRTDLFHAVPPVLTCFASVPFRVGYCPIQRVMHSPCLSAAGLRFSKHPFPLRSHVPYGSPTVCGHADRIGVSTFRSHKMRPGWVPSFCRGRGVHDTSRHKRGIHSHTPSSDEV